MRYRGNDYSVPTRHGHLQVLVRGYVHEVTIACGGEVIAKHPRSYEREATIYDPLHYLALLEHKTRRSTRPRRFKAGSCRRASPRCAVCSKQG